MSQILFYSACFISGIIADRCYNAYLSAKAKKAEQKLLAEAQAAEAKAKADAIAINNAVIGLFTKAKEAGSKTLDDALTFIKKETEK